MISSMTDDGFSDGMTFMPVARERLLGRGVILTPEQIEKRKTERPRRDGNTGCGPGIVVWLFMRWYGVPQPIRWWWWIHGFRTDELPGCGCIVKLKALSVAARWTFQYVRKA